MLQYLKQIVVQFISNLVLRKERRLGVLFYPAYNHAGVIVSIVCFVAVHIKLCIKLRISWMVLCQVTVHNWEEQIYTSPVCLCIERYSYSLHVHVSSLVRVRLSGAGVFSLELILSTC
jgi:hypothetical protein